MFEQTLVSFAASAGALDIAQATVIVDRDDFPGVHHAARDLAGDLSKVTSRPLIPHRTMRGSASSDDPLPKTAIIVGCLERSPLLQSLAKNKVIDYAEIQGKWESFMTVIVNRPFPDCERALVIAGSDKRGAIFGVYTLSEQMGVSPWYWWADVPPRKHLEIYALPIQTVHGEPSVRYRGIFINDEAPALTGWVLEKFGRYGVDFYAKVFELLLRLKANFMWPAMWPGYPNPGAVFFKDDDGANQKLADEYGIVMSTSHHEPMQRATTEWFLENSDGSWDWLTNREKITKFFDEGARRAQDCETYFTLGMRGEYDKKMVTDDPTAVVRDVIETQRSILADVYGNPSVPRQLLALYKEVLEQFEGGGLNVPEDVTLLFTDDNHGTIRRLPTATEAQRSGGAGIYYHLEYVGTPRSYKWINSNALGKVWHQLQEAYRRHARQVWVFNVGDIKPLEIPMTFCLSLAYDINSVRCDDFPRFYRTLAAREFGTQWDEKVSLVWQEYDRLASLRKHEMIEPETFSLLHYKEADSILARWSEALRQAHDIHDQIDRDLRPALFQLVLHPVKASFIYVALRIAQAKNRLFARQRRNSANAWAQKALLHFEEDFDLQETYHALLDGKWNRMLSQTHYGYEDTWHAPSRDMISGLCYVQRRQNSNPIVGQLGVAVEDHEGVRPGRINEESERTHPSRRDLVPGVTFRPLTRYEPNCRWFELFTRGNLTIHWSVESESPWVRLDQKGGTLHPNDPDVRVVLTVDWDQVLVDFEGEALIGIRSEEGDFEQLHLPLSGRRLPESFAGGYVESSGYVSIPAPLPSDGLSSTYRALPYAGRTSTGSVTVDGDIPEVSPWLSYKVYTFSQGKEATLWLYFSMTLDVDPETPMRYDVQVDDGEIRSCQLLQASKATGGSNDAASAAQVEGWFDAVQNGVWKRSVHLSTEFQNPGEHMIRVRFRHTNMMLETLVLDLGGLKPSYLGPPSSIRV